MRIFVLLLTSVLMAFALTPNAVLAQTRIVAVVNGSAITSYDVSQRQRLLRLTGVKGNLQSRAMEELIDERVQIDAAKKVRIVPTDAQVDRAVADIAKRVKMSPAQLRSALSSQGVNIKTLQERLRAQIAFGELVRARFNQRSMVSEQDLVAALLKDKERENSREAAAYDLQRVTIALPENPSSQRLRRAQGNAESLRKKFTSCRSGIETARKTRNVVVQPYGRRMEQDLSPQVRDALAEIPVGRLSKPIQTPRGLVMFAVCDKKMVRSTNAAMKDIEAEMRNEKGQQFQKQYARQLRRDAVVERY